jgi:hypothetical protein
MKNYYRILEVTPDADAETIERVYQRLARRLEKDPSNEAKARLRNVNEAYAVLSDPQARAEYDRKRSGGTGAQARGGEGNRRLIIGATAGVALAAALAAAIVIVFIVTGDDDGELILAPTPTVGPTATTNPNITPGPETPPAVGSVFVTTDTGLQVADIQVGTGAEVIEGVPVTVHYTGWLEDGTKFDSSLDRGQPFSVTLGQTPPQVIPGWEEGLLGMKVGGKRRLVIPPELAYGDAGQGSIPPGATLTFDIEVLEVVQQ